MRSFWPTSKGRGGEGRGREDGEGGWVGGPPLCEILNTPLAMAPPIIWLGGHTVFGPPPNILHWNLKF